MSLRLNGVDTLRLVWLVTDATVTALTRSELPSTALPNTTSASPGPAPPPAVVNWPSVAVKSVPPSCGLPCVPEIRNTLSSAEPGAPTGSSTEPKLIEVPGKTGLPWRSVPSALTVRLSVASGFGGMPPPVRR